MVESEVVVSNLTARTYCGPGKADIVHVYSVL